MLNISFEDLGDGESLGWPTASWQSWMGTLGNWWLYARNTETPTRTFSLNFSFGCFVPTKSSSISEFRYKMCCMALKFILNLEQKKIRKDWPGINTTCYLSNQVREPSGGGGVEGGLNAPLRHTWAVFRHDDRCFVFKQGAFIMSQFSLKTFHSWDLWTVDAISTATGRNIERINRTNLSRNIFNWP